MTKHNRLSLYFLLKLSWRSWINCSRGSMPKHSQT